MSLLKSPAMTAAKLAAQRSNARRSTGPRTAPGKSRSRWNALKHGGFAVGAAWTADTLRALGEDPEEFENLRQGLLASDGPAHDPLWIAQIEDLVRLYWRRRRVEEAWIPASNNVKSATGRRWQTPSMQVGPMLLQQLDVLDRAIDRKARLLVRMRADEDRRLRQPAPPDDPDELDNSQPTEAGTMSCPEDSQTAAPRESFAMGAPPANSSDKPAERGEIAPGAGTALTIQTRGTNPGY
jgi:hypothetical protein